MRTSLNKPSQTEWFIAWQGAKGSERKIEISHISDDNNVIQKKDREQCKA